MYLLEEIFFRKAGSPITSQERECLVKLESVTENCGGFAHTLGVSSLLLFMYAFANVLLILFFIISMENMFKDCFSTHISVHMELNFFKNVFWVHETEGDVLTSVSDTYYKERAVIKPPCSAKSCNNSSLILFTN